MKIIALQAENIKRIVAIDIRPDTNVVQITGKNGQGKTSVLDAIWWCLAGAGKTQSQPIRNGKDEGYVTIDLGEMIVTRTFKINKDGETTSSLRVENKDGVKFSSPQAMLDKMLGDLTFDPLAFARMDAKKQFDTLRLMVPGFDFEGMERKYRSDYERRTELNRDSKKLRHAADQIVTSATEQTKKINTDDLLQKITEASRHNSDIQIRENNRKNMKREIEQKRTEAARITAEADALQAKLDSAPALPELIDVTELQSKVSAAGIINDSVYKFEQKKTLIEQAEKLEKESEELTSRMELTVKNKQDAIAAANIPVEGITFGDNQIMLNGVPFNQGSDAEQLRASLGIAMALNPKLKVIRVRDGSLLDEDSMKIVEQMADKNNFQIFIERVDSSGKVGIVMENGLVRKQEEETLENF